MEHSSVFVTSRQIDDKPILEMRLECVGAYPEKSLMVVALIIIEKAEKNGGNIIARNPGKQRVRCDTCFFSLEFATEEEMMQFEKSISKK